MKLPFAEPDPAGSERARNAKKIRDLATEVSRLQPQALTKSNAEESDHSDYYPANFTKGLYHNKWGILEQASDYRCLVEAINSPDRTLFEKHVITAKHHGIKYHCVSKKNCCDGTRAIKWRGWESPRAGHVYELEGPDAGSVGMSPAPRVGSSELAAEMAEVYSLAILRDVPFTTICEGGADKLCGGKSILSAKQITDLLNSMPFYTGNQVCSSSPCTQDSSGFNRFERNRRYSRTLSENGSLSTESIFRGSTPGAHVGPYLSQFMLIGAPSIACGGGGRASYPAKEAPFDLQDGYIP